MAEAADVKTNEAGERMVKGLVLGDTLGKGTFGFVKLGTKKESGHQFALKFLKRNVKNFNEEEVKKEIDCMKLIRHPNVVALLASTMKCKYPKEDGGYENTVLMVMELATGGDLYDVIYYAGAMDEKLGRTYMKQLLDGCGAIHAQGITHRDLKPNNILIDHKYQLKITDFGLSHIADQGVDPHQKRMKTSWVGTRGYRAPELVLKARYSNQADVFALGVCLFVMLCARQPFKVASSSDPWYKCIATKQFDKYWRSHKSSKLSKEAKLFLQCLLCYQPRERLTIAKSYEDAWMQSDMYDVNQLPGVMKKSHKLANEKKNNDEERKQRLENSEPGPSRGPGHMWGTLDKIVEEKVGDEVKQIEIWSYPDIPVVSVLPEGYRVYILDDKLREPEMCDQELTWICSDLSARLSAAVAKSDTPYHAKAKAKLVLEGKEPTTVVFNMRIFNVQTVDDAGTTVDEIVFGFQFPKNLYFSEEMNNSIELTTREILDACAHNQIIKGAYEQELFDWIGKPKEFDYKDFDFGELEKEDKLDETQEEEVEAANS